MDTARHVLGVLLVISLPPAIAYWLLIHPFAWFWRKLGPRVSFLTVGSLCVLVGMGFYRFRTVLLGTDLGTNWPFIALGAVLYGASAWITVITRRQLKLSTLAGLPEVSDSEEANPLLQEGIYDIIRHPRYLSVVIGTAGFALVVNYRGAYLVVLASMAGLFLVALMEERELATRYGSEYVEYRARVPSIFPSALRPITRRQGGLPEADSERGPSGPSSERKDGVAGRRSG